MISNFHPKLLKEYLEMGLTLEELDKLELIKGYVGMINGIHPSYHFLCESPITRKQFNTLKELKEFIKNYE